MAWKVWKDIHLADPQQNDVAYPNSLHLLGFTTYSID